MGRDDRQVIKQGSPVTTIVVGVIIIILILMLGFLIYAGKINLPMFGSARTNSDSGTAGNGSGTNADNGNDTGADNGTSTNGANGSDGSTSGGSTGTSGLNVNISVDPKKPAAGVNTTNPNTNTNTPDVNNVKTGL